MILTDLPIEITVAHVLRAQGMDPDLVKSKSPRLIEITKKAIDMGYPYLEPRVAYERYTIQRFTDTGLILENSKSIEGELISNYFVNSQEIVAAVCTIGSNIDELTSETFQKNPALAMALEGLASVSTEILGNSFCNYLDKMAKSEGLSTTLPINPGIVGWTVEDGQPQLFDLVETSNIGVKLDSSRLMTPLKSLSMVIGIGHNLKHHKKSCDLCNLHNTCLYKPDPVK